MTITVCGFDMTSVPCRRKPITCAVCSLKGNTLSLVTLEPLESVEAFRQRLADARACCSEPKPVGKKKATPVASVTPDPPGMPVTDHADGPLSYGWIAGLDFPFGQARAFLVEAGWPLVWEDYVRHAAGLSKEGFAQSIYAVMRQRRKGEKLIRRITDAAANAISPMSLAYVPVGRMFHVLAPIMETSGATVVPVRMNGDARVLLEAYPALLARAILGRRPYKDGPPAQKVLRSMNRAALLAALPEHVHRTTGLELAVSSEQLAVMRDDPRGDYLDALLCAIQAAHACFLPEWGMPGSERASDAAADSGPLSGRYKHNGPVGADMLPAQLDEIGIMRQTEGWIVGTGLPE